MGATNSKGEKVAGATPGPTITVDAGAKDASLSSAKVPVSAATVKRSESVPESRTDDVSDSGSQVSVGTLLDTVQADASAPPCTPLASANLVESAVGEENVEPAKSAIQQLLILDEARIEHLDTDTATALRRLEWVEADLCRQDRSVEELKVKLVDLTEDFRRMGALAAELAQEGDPPCEGQSTPSADQPPKAGE